MKSTKAPTSTDYEKITQRIYQDILNSNQIDNINVEHDIKIKGESGVSHQIDVFWEYRKDNIYHKTLIECKHFNKDPVSLLHARNMVGLLTDIPNSQGIIVTTQGFQSGVVDFCRHYKILLKKIRSPQDSDWDGSIQKLSGEFKFYSKGIVNLNFVLDEHDKETKNYADRNGTNFNFELENRTITEDDISSPLVRWLDQKFINKNGIEGQENETTLETKNAFLNLSNGTKLKINKIVVVWKLEIQESFELDAKDFVQAVLEDFNSENIEYMLPKTRSSILRKD